MKKSFIFLSLLLLLAGGVSAEGDGAAPTNAVAPAADLGRYQSILDRMPFGQPPPGFDPALPPGTKGNGGPGAGGGEEMTAEQRTEEEQRLASSVRVSMINVTPSGKTMVGFTDSTAQPPVHYYLRVGEKAMDGSHWEVTDADPAESKATLSKDGLSVTLALGEGNAGGDKKGGGAPRPRGLMRRGGPSLASAAPAPVAAEPAAAGGGHLARLRARAAQQRQEEAARRRAADEQAKQDREQREQEKAQQAAEREEQRNALLQIQEELRRQREEKARKPAEGAEEGN